jgi:hypothetical protein
MILVELHKDKVSSRETVLLLKPSGNLYITSSVWTEGLDLKLLLTVEMKKSLINLVDTQIIKLSVIE